MDIADLLSAACNRGGKTSKLCVNKTVYAAAVKERANGQCDLCGQPAPFNNTNGFPYLEHHLVRLSDRGNASIENVVALCSNCHKKCVL